MTRMVLRLAGPLVVERLSISVLGAVDALLVGHFVGSDGVAAVGIAGLMFWIPLAGAFGLDIATTAVIARDYGARNHESIERTMRASLLAAFVWGCLATLFLWFMASPLMTLMDAEGATKSFGVDYLRSASIGFPGLMVLYAASGVLRGLGNTVVSMLIIIALNVVNAIVGFLLISGVIGIELEVVAAGISYAAGGIAGGVLAMGVLVSGYGPIKYHFSRAFETGREEIRRLANVGVPSGLEEMQFMAAFIVYSRIVTGLGTTAIASHTIALRTLEIALVPGFALGAASTTLVSRYLGAGRPDLAERAAKEGLRWAVGLMLVMGGTLAFFAPEFTRIFIDSEKDPEVVSVATRCLRVFAVAFPFMGLHASLGGALRGAGDNRYVLGVLTFTAWCIRIPLAALLALGVGWGAPGAWIGATAENIIRGLIIRRRFRQGQWKKKKV